MVRFKVIKASHLLLGAAIIVFAAVLTAVLLHVFAPKRAHPVGAQASFVENEAGDEGSLEAASASLSFDPALIPRSTGQPDKALTIEVVKETPSASQSMPRILIYHTHTHEAYQQEEGDPYPALELWRTEDNDHNVVRVGEELTQLLREKGFRVVHDTTDHEQDSLSTAYNRSLETLKNYQEPFDLYIDLHRDALTEATGAVSVSAGAHRLARLMVLIGRGDGFSEKPYYDENLAFAQRLTDRLNRPQDGICRDVMVKKNRYNQHIGSPAILIEVGSNRNTLSEALASMPILADGLEQVLLPEEGASGVRLTAEGK